MAMIRKLVPSHVSLLGEDEIEAVIMTGDIARDGHILVPGGVDLANYLRNPVVLWQHNPDEPVGNAEAIRIEGDQIIARVRFAPLGISEVADRTRGLVKSGVIQAVSVGFEPLDGEPLDPTKPRGGQRFTRWDLLEFSFVSVPADTGAVVTARSVEPQEPDMSRPSKRAGKTISSVTRDVLDTAHDKIDAARCMIRDLLDDTDTTEFQTTDGEGESDGTANGRALSLEHRRRRAVALSLAAA